MYRIPTTILTLLAALLLASGCSKSPADDSTAATGLNLTDEFGGYTASAEKPAFGDPTLVAEATLNEGEEYDDPILQSPGMGAVVSDTLGGFYHLRALWGRLCLDTASTDIVDWSGSLSISDGAMIIRRTIHFELGQDYIPTRTDRQLVEWVSYTTVHNDGVMIDIHVPDTVDLAAVTLDFTTGPYTRTFALAELVALDTIVYLEDVDSNAVAFYGFQLNRRVCPHGHLMGGWGYDEDGEGVFRGTWMSRSGWVAGYLNGHFGQTDDGDQVFFGKWINRSGECEGLLRGIYGPIGNGDGFGNGNGNGQGDDHGNQNRRHRGWFAGDVFDAAEVPIGVMKGKYSSRANRANGFFAGRWKLSCDSAATDLDTSAEGF